MAGEFTVKWSEDDDEYVATAAGFLSLSYLSDDPVAALEGLMEIVCEAEVDGD